MVKRKWYVVVVGRDIGVFPSWVDAGPLVKGVPNAVHQSFTTREEALRRFQEAQAKGATQIVDPDRDAPPNGPRRLSGNRPHSFTSTPSRAPFPTSQTRMNSNYTSPDRIRRTTPPQTSPSSSLSWSSSEPSPKLSRLQEIQTAFDRLAVGVESRASSVMSPTRSSQTSARTRTSTGEVSGRSLQRASTASPEVFRGSRSGTENSSSRTPRVIVRTPSWILPYSKSSTPAPTEGTLSPLSSVNLKLHSFSADDRHDYDVSRSPTVSQQSASNETQSPSNSLKTPYQATTTTTSGDVRAGQRIIRTRRIMHDTDPRSPILDQSQVPELVYDNPFSFIRPSPQVRHDPLPTPPSSSRVGSSLLFKHETPLSPMRG